MYTSTVGQIFLDHYNKVKNKQYTPKTFFYEKFYPLFFDHNKYLMTGYNSPLENPKISWNDIILKQKDKEYETKEQRRERLERFKIKVENGEIDASNAMGYPTVDNTTGTSGQKTEMEIEFSENDLYTSWFGAALGLGVAGGLNILFTEPELLMDIYEGWYQYRNYLNGFDTLKGNQINVWNTIWIIHSKNPRVFNPEKPHIGIDDPKDQKGIASFKTKSWIELITRVALTMDLTNSIGYIYNFGKTNKTYGFIPFNIPQIKKPYELYRRLFGENDYLVNENKIIQIFGTGAGLNKAVEKGEIGLEALMPKELKEYMERGKLKKNKDAEEQRVTFNTYITWMVAMLNNEELWEKSKEIAKVLENYTEGEGIKTKKANEVKKLFTVTNKRQLIEDITVIIQNSDNDNTKELMCLTAQALHQMRSEDVRYFMTLVRLHYVMLGNNVDL